MLPGTIGALDIAAAIGRPPPTPEQIAVIEAPPGPLLVVAGAGSGKTETMAARVVWLVANELTAPDQVLGLTFTRKASGELAERVRRRLRRLATVGLVPALESVEGDPDISTYHAFAGRLVREHALRLGVEPESRLLTEAASWQYASEVVERWEGDMSAVNYSPATIVDAVLRLSSECAEHLVELTDLESYLDRLGDQIEDLPSVSARGTRPVKTAELLRAVRTRRQVVPLVRDYAARKLTREALDFGDQLALAARLARDFPDIGRTERMRTATVLLDEFQDTSHAQLVMLKELFGGGHSVTAVGDPHQSIYGWRGASAGTLSRFAAEFGGSEGTAAAQLSLSTSWRNDRAVLEVANVVSRPLREQTRGIDVHPLVPSDQAGAGVVQAGRWLTLDDEAAAVAAWIAERWRGTGGHARVSSAAVLCRTRSQFVPVEAALRAAGLPVEVVGLGGLLSTPEVVDVVCALQVVADPGRGDALMRLLTGPICRLGPRDVRALGRWAKRQRVDAGGRSDSDDRATDDRATDDRARDDRARDDQMPDPVDESSIVEALDALPPPGWTSGGVALSAAGRLRLGRLAGLLRGLRSRAALPLAELVVKAERDLGLDIEVAARPGLTYGSARAHLDALAEVAAGFAASADVPTLSAFLAWLEAAEFRERGLAPGQADSAEADPQPTDGRPGDVEVSQIAVQVLTVHAAKGLEWDVVAVPGLVEGVLPFDVPSVREDKAAGTWKQDPDKSGGWRPISQGGVPYPLRGDRDSLPDLRLARCPDSQAFEVELLDFYGRCGQSAVAEERRLAYVAFTRARAELLLSAHVWGTPEKTPRKLSRFLLAVLEDPRTRAVVEVLPGWAEVPDPAPGLQNPLTAEPAHAVWPYDPLGPRRAIVEEAAALVRSAATATATVGAVSRDRVGLGGEAGRWALEIELLLAERTRGRSLEVDVELPTHLSASRLVRLAEDPLALAADLRRPMPRPPAPEARRGTAFHAWVEQLYGAAAIVDVLELPGAADEGPAEDSRLPELQANFRASEWADRIPTAIEVSIETPVAGTVLRGRIDAVFPSEGGGWDVVDWKTGSEPSGSAAQARAVQLAAYRLAWARLQGVPVERVGAAFFYAATGHTVRPVDLLDEDSLRALVTGA
jgi:DNA helicase II / ATP-dependent DNA helicase PcrA